MAIRRDTPAQRIEARFYCATGALPARLETPDGLPVEFLRALDVSARGLGLETSQPLTPQQTLVLRENEGDPSTPTIALTIVYCVLVPDVGTYRTGFRACDPEADLVAWIRARGGAFLVPMTDEQVLPEGLLVDRAPGR